MARTSFVVTTLAMLGALGGLVYVHVSRDTPDGSKATTPSVAVPAVTTDATVDEPGPVPVRPASAPLPASDDVERWIADTLSNDAKSRAAAIQALANAPTEQSLPALERVLESGEPQVDRQIALRSLHILALHDGDENGAVRDVIRKAMYHSEDEGVTQSAQAVLEDIEAELAERAQKD